MKLHFDAQQPYQLDAIHAVVDLFAGQPAAAGTFEWQTNALEPELLDALGTANELALSDARLLANLRAVQERNDLATADALADDDILGGRNFSVEMETGTFSVDAAGVGETVIFATYRFLFQPDRGPLQREGARRMDLDTPLMQSLVLGRDGEQLTLALGGDGRNLTSLPEVIRRLEPDTQAGAEDIFRLVNIMFYMSQTRVQGFGATGMTMYVEPKDFVGIVSGEYTVAVTGGLRIGSDLTYRALRDLTDIQMDGNQHTMVDLGGNGPTSEMLTFTLDHPDTDPIIYTIFYDDLLVVNGAAGDGFYTVDSNGDTFVVDWMLAQDVHVRNVLPVGE